jgi:hypothetical protein
MATSINGNVRLTYGNHTHNENYDGSTNAYTYTNQGSQYSAGSARATSSVALDQGTIDGAEGLLLIKNVNTYGGLFLSMDGGSNWDIKIPAGFVNLISVGPDHAVYVKSASPNHSGYTISETPPTTGVITFGSTVSSAGEYIMTATSSPDHSTTGPDFIVKVTEDGATTGTVYELDGTTVKKDLAATNSYTSSTIVSLTSFADYRFTLTEQ